MIRISRCFLVVFLVTMGLAINAFANDGYYGEFNAFYGTSGPASYQPVLGSCLTCHTSGSTRNPYGVAWRNNNYNFATIEPLDSDGDGFTNIAEIDAGTFPGDPNSKPVVANNPPIANAGPDQTVIGGTVVTLNGSNSTDPGGTISLYAWEQTGGPTVTLTNADTVSATFTAPATGTGGTPLTFQLTVADNVGLTSRDTCVVNVTAANRPPVANAGADQVVNEGILVTLNGSNSSDPDGSIRSYLWTRTAGPSVTLSSSTSAQPTFTAPNVGTTGASLTFQLTVTDNGGLQATDSCIVNVSWVNAPPVANAGADQIVNEGILVTLNGSNSSDPDGSIATYAWRQTAGTNVTLSNAAVANPTFTAPNVGTAGASLTFQLTVTDSGGLQATDSSIVNVSWVNAPPVANAGPDQTVNAGAAVALNGSGSSDQDNGIASYQWSQTAGTNVTLSNAAVANPTFTAPAGITTGMSLAFELRVTDSDGLSARDTCTVNVTPVAPVNRTPTANAGPDQTVVENTTVALVGSNSSDPDGTIATYAWRQTAGTNVTLSNAAAASPTFTAPTAGATGTSLTFQLTVTDNGGLSATDACTVNVTPAPPAPVNQPPVASAGSDQTVDSGATVSLNGSASTDPENGIVSYLWAQTAGPAVTLSDPTDWTPTFTAPDAIVSESAATGGTALTFQLTVRDDGGLTATDTCIVNVIPLGDPSTNLPPEADAGEDQWVQSRATVTLDGSNSYDPEEGILTYEWKQIKGRPVTLSDSTAGTPTFRAPAFKRSGALTFRLTVTDQSGLKSSDTCVVHVSGNSRERTNTEYDEHDDD
jgi:hypothetical protein